MAAEHGSKIEPARGNLGVLIVGLGAVSTTLIAGVEAVKQGLAEPIGSVTEMGRIRLGKRTEDRNPLIKDFVPLADLKDLRFGAWDICSENAYEAAITAEVLDRALIDKLKPALDEIRPMSAVFDQNYVKRLRGEQVKQGRNHLELAKQVRDDIARFKERENCDRMVMIYAASTEAYMKPGEEHQDLTRFKKALGDNSPNISPSMIYAYAALKSGVPFINGTPGFAVDIPAMRLLAKVQGLPVAGKDFKTGQTLLKTALAPMFKARMLGLDGWYSFNVLGNRDGEVLQDPGSFESKRVTKGSVLGTILQPDLHPGLYGDLEHRVSINYYGPAKDDKEAWDRIDIFGWLGYKMGIRVNFQCKDSILAAPVALDLVRFMDLAQRSGMSGVQEWLSFYFKEPMTAPGLYAEHDLAIQQMKLKNRLRYLKGEELITHLGLEYYD
ncbi:inositol-3-phosphate synthase [Patescibacteria group bacterium]|nr:inositol-3-phosphate synthase [Patescibacteria group bacterium]